MSDKKLTIPEDLQELHNLAVAGTHIENDCEVVNALIERIASLEQQLEQEQQAHNQVASILFAAGIETSDGTSVSAARNAAAELAQADVGKPYRAVGGFMVTPGGYFQLSSAQEQVLFDQCVRAETAEAERDTLRAQLEQMSRPVTDGSEQYYILTKAHEALWPRGVILFWGPESSGYSTTLEMAGRYSKEDAERICKLRPQPGAPQEWMVPCDLIERESRRVVDIDRFNAILSACGRQ